MHVVELQASKFAGGDDRRTWYENVFADNQSGHVFPFAHLHFTSEEFISLHTFDTGLENTSCSHERPYRRDQALLVFPMSREGMELC